MLALTRHFGELWATGLGSAGLLLFTLINFTVRMSELRQQVKIQMGSNLFGGLADAAINAVQLQWGWAVLMAGSVLIVVAAALRNHESRTTDTHTESISKVQWVYAGVVASVLLFFFVNFFIAAHQHSDVDPETHQNSPVSSSDTTKSMEETPNIRSSPETDSHARGFCNHSFTHR